MSFKVFFSLFVAMASFLSAFADPNPYPDLKTAGDPSKFVADPTIITNFNFTAGSYGWTEYKQCDSRWANQGLGYCSQTICQSGCAMSSVAMILKTKGVSHDPGSLDKWLTQNGGYANGCDIYWAKVDYYGKTSYQGIQRASESEICNGLNAKHGLVANVNGGGHWVLLTACAGNGVYYVNDPGYSKTTYKHSEIVQVAVYH